MFKKDTNKFYRNLGMKNIEARERPSMAEVQPYWQLMWGRKSTAQCKRRMDKRSERKNQ
jgi:hypothetical protein